MLQKLFEEVSALPEDEKAIVSQILQNFLNASKELSGVLGKKADHYNRMAALSAFTGKLLGQHSRGLLTQTQDAFFLIDPQDYAIGWQLRTDGAYGADQLAILNKVLNEDSHLLIVGGHVGTIAIPVAKKGISTVVIEANPDTFRLLELNLLLNAVNNCEIHPIAANDKNEEIRFLLNRSNSGGSKRKPLIDQHMYNYDNPGEIVVQGYALDDYLQGQVFDTIFMDIEGSEYFALKGMPRLLEQCSTLIMEFLPHHLKHIAGVTVDELLATLPAFETLIIPSLKIQVAEDKFSSILQQMYDNDLGDDGIIFVR
jgi:FkbM family methyltransferase